MPLSYLADGNYNTGMIRDAPSWQLPAGGTYDQLNMLNDYPGIARMRSGTSNLSAATANAFCTSIGFCYSADATPIEELYGMDGKTGTAYSISKTTGAATSLGVVAAANSIVGRPVRHFGFLVFPTGFSRSVIMAGQTNSTTFTSAGTTVITAANPQINLGGPDTTASLRVGMYVHAVTAATAYAGRIVSIDTGSLFTVWPVPTISLSPTAGSFTGRPAFGLGNTNGGVCATSFQNRLLFGQSFDMAANKSTGAITRADRRVNYGVLPTETGINITQVYSGASGFLFAPSWPVLNYFDVPGADPIVAMEPISDGELLILTSTGVIIFQGSLVTELGDTSPSVTYDIYPLGVTEGCLSDLSVQRTPVGIMWAGAEGVFAYWPPLRRSPAKTGVRNLCEGKILKYWLSLVNATDFAIHGAAYARDHYFISGFANGATWALSCNLAGNQWSRLSGAGTDIFNSVRRPSIPGQTFAARYWDQAGAAPSMTNGQIVRLESMLNPHVYGTSNQDSDNATIPVSITTRTITGDAETQKMFQRITVEAASDQSSANMTVTAQSTIDAADINASRTRALGSLSNTATLVITNATNATPIVVTTAVNHGLQTNDFIDIDGVLGNLNANGRYRIASINSTSFSLVGSSGSAAYTSGGTCKKMTETVYQASALNKGQGASVTVAGTGPNYFELHGVKLAVLQQEPVPA